MHRSITFGQQSVCARSTSSFLWAKMQFTVTFAKQRGTPAQSLFGAAVNITHGGGEVIQITAAAVQPDLLNYFIILFCFWLPGFGRIPAASHIVMWHLVLRTYTREIFTCVIVAQEEDRSFCRPLLFFQKAQPKSKHSGSWSFLYYIYYHYGYGAMGRNILTLCASERRQPPVHK